MMCFGQITVRVYRSVLVINFIKVSVVNGATTPAAHNLSKLEAAINCIIQSTPIHYLYSVSEQVGLLQYSQ